MAEFDDNSLKIRTGKFFFDMKSDVNLKNLICITLIANILNN